jgi:hypothetical protein
MVRQICTAKVDTNADGAYSTPLGIVLETNGDAALFADPLVERHWCGRDRPRWGPRSVQCPAHGIVAPALVGRTDAPVMTASDPVYTGTYLNGIVLTNPTTQNRVTVAATGYVTNQTMTYSGDAIYLSIFTPIVPAALGGETSTSPPAKRAPRRSVGAGVIEGSRVGLIEVNEGKRGRLWPAT